MADTPSIIAGVFHQPFPEQLAFFRGKLGNLVPTQRWDDIRYAAHDSGFMVAGAAKADLLSDLAAAVERTIAEGTSIDAWRQDFFRIVADHGWTNYTGAGTVAGRAWRTRVIYTTNAQTSYSAGRLAQLRDGNFPLWVYRHTPGEQFPRPLHESWDGITLPPSHPFWRTHSTPNGWGCQCYIVGARSADGARRLGGNPAKRLPADWDEIDPKTGEPRGIDEGWGYAPGDTVAQTVQDIAAKIQHWPYTIAKAYMQSVPTDVRDALATSYRRLPSTADDARRYAQRVLSGNTTVDTPPYHTLGLATSKQVTAINGLKRDLDVSGYDFALDPDGIHHVQTAHGDPQTEAALGQQAVTTADYATLPTVLNASNATIGYTGIARTSKVPTVRISARIKGQAYVTVWRVLRKRRMLALQSFFLGRKP